MKKLLVWGLALGTLAVVVADLMHQNDGYALIVLSSWRIEMSLNFLVLAVLSTLLVGAFLLKLLQGTLRLPGRIARYRALRRQRKGEQTFLSSLRLLLEGHFEASIKAAERSRKLGFATGYADMLAARAAQGLDDQDRAAVWLGRVDADDRALVAARLQRKPRCWLRVVSLMQRCKCSSWRSTKLNRLEARQVCVLNFERCSVQNAGRTCYYKCVRCAPEMACLRTFWRAAAVRHIWVT